MNEPLLSVVVPVHNEEACLERTQAELATVLGRLAEGDLLAYEILYVDDGSSDRSLELLRRFAAEERGVRYCSLSRNFGHEAATSCGLRHCRGEAAVIIDADLQDPPELIGEMVRLWREGYQVVAGRRLRRDGESAWTRFTSHLFYRVLGRFSEVQVPLDVGDFRLVDRVVIDHFNQFAERNRFVRALFPWIGFRQTVLPYRRRPPPAGASNYDTFKRLWLALDALAGFSVAPLRLATVIGLGITLMSILAGAAVLVDKLFFGLALPGYALLASGMFFLGGVQLTFLGLIGEYVGKIYREVQGRPLYIVREVGGGE